MISAAISIYRSNLEQGLDKLLEFLDARLRSDLHGLNVEALVSRKKSSTSIQQKLQTGKYADIRNLQDLAGITVVLLYRHEIPEAIRLLKDTDLQIDDPGPIEVPPTNFRYHEPKLFVCPPPSYLKRNSHLLVKTCEVQFTTALQHALDKATHDFDYKGSNFSWSNFRLVAQMRGVLEMIDRTIDGIEDVDLDDDPTAKAPQDMVRAAELLPILRSHFSNSMPDDQRRFAETVLSWIDAAQIAAHELDSALYSHSDIVAARSLDPTSGVLGVILRDHAANLIANFNGRFLVSAELTTLCQEATLIPEDRRVAGLSTSITM